MGYLNTFITKQAAGFSGPVPIEGMSHAQWNNFAKELGPLTGQSKSFFRNSAAMADYMAQHGLRNMDDLTAHIQGLRGGGTPAMPRTPAATAAPKVPTTQLPHYVDQHFPLANSAAPVSPKATPKVAPKAPTMQLPHYVDQHFPLADSAAPISPKPTAAPAPAPASAPAPANKPINYARRTWNSAKSLGRNTMGMGRQGFTAAKAMAKRNPKLAALLAIGGTLAGGSLMAGAANSGRPTVRQSNATNPFAGLETY